MCCKDTDYYYIDANDPALVDTPGKLGMRHGSLLHAQTEVLALRLALKRLAEKPLLPKELGVFKHNEINDYVPPDPAKKKRRFTQVGVP